ncbi:Uncharacterized protein APZ42_014627 [Daphnia magna]|uniref:Uncharacterized protein n=1 Tax=Daphnia magna TaxID=35525 RepID=A0A162PRR5_9CRUS|nr:Uncharacterized protein APZ42_014627 [Daphnia magna]
MTVKRIEKKKALNGSGISLSLYLFPFDIQLGGRLYMKEEEVFPPSC